MQIRSCLTGYIFGIGKEEVTIAVVGDSLTQPKASYKMTLEHFYITRYSDRKITFVNKGIGGEGSDTVISRFDWDVMDCEGKKPDAAILMLGMNDNGPYYYADYSKLGSTQWHYNQFVKNYTKLVSMFIENDIPVVLMSPTLYDEMENDALSETNYSCEEYGANRTGLKNISGYTKALAADNGLPYIPMNEITTDLNERIRAAYPETGTLFTGSDRVHPTMTGAAFEGFLFAEEQTKNTQISYVSIDSQTKTVKAENAEVIDVEASEAGVSYIYRPKAIPLAATEEYRQIVSDFGYDLTTKLNNEIIKISGLADGSYTVTFDGEYILGTYTADELSNGINIAVNENNPSQIAAKKAYKLLIQKDTASDSYRSLVRYRARMQRSGIDMQDDSAVKEYLSDTDYGIYISLLNREASLKENISSLREQACELSVPQVHTVSIKR